MLDPRSLFHRKGNLALLQRSRVCVHGDDVLQMRKLVTDLANLGYMYLLGEDGGGSGISKPYHQ